MSEVKMPMEVSVKGVAAYTWLDKPDEKFAKDGKGKYKLTLVVDKDELPDLPARLENGKQVISGSEWLAHIQELHEDTGGRSESPVRDGDVAKKVKGKALDLKEEFRGKWLIQFQSRHAPKQIDTAKGDVPTTMRVRAGDVVKVSYQPFQYDAFGGGVSLRMSIVMLLDKRSGGGDVSVFGDDEDGFVAPVGATDDTYDGGDGDY